MSSHSELFFPSLLIIFETLGNTKWINSPWKNTNTCPSFSQIKSIFKNYYLSFDCPNLYLWNLIISILLSINIYIFLNAIKWSFLVLLIISSLVLPGTALDSNKSSFSSLYPLNNLLFKKVLTREPFFLSTRMLAKLRFCHSLSLPAALLVWMALQS